MVCNHLRLKSLSRLHNLQRKESFVWDHPFKDFRNDEEAHQIHLLVLSQTQDRL